MAADKDSFLEHFQGKIFVIRIKDTILTRLLLLPLLSLKDQ